MSVETRGRQAGEDLRRTTIVDVESGLVRVRRTRRRRDIGRLAIAAVVLAAAVGGALAERDRDAALEPVKPGPVRNGEIVPPEQGELGWKEFDQPSGSFLYFPAPGDAANAAGDHYAVVGKDGGELADLACPFSSECGGPQAFGPGPQEVSIVEHAGRELRVVGYDGAVRDTINLGDALAGEMPASIAWSPDGRRLAVSTDCEHMPADCRAQVWIMDRDGGNPGVVHSEPAPTALVEGTKLQPLLRELTWSPDGDTLAFIVHTDACGAASDAGVWPHLVALRIQTGRATGAETLHVYDDINCHGDLFPVHYPAHYNFAWSPDGTRLAVTSAGGFSEISATDGEVLARHTMSFDAGEDQVTGPLAWLRAP
jgi:WD40-like Beta Propeller Repeat